MIEINTTDDYNFVCEERADIFLILKAMDLGFEFRYDDNELIFHELVSNAWSYIMKHWKTEMFVKCNDVRVDKKKHYAEYHWDDGYGCTPYGICTKEYFGDERVIEREDSTWEYIKPDDKDYEKAHRLVKKHVDSLGRLIQLYC